MAVEMSEQNFVTKLIMPHSLLGICSTCPYPKGYTRPSPWGRYRSKSEGRFTIEYRQVDQKAGLNKILLQNLIMPQTLLGSVLHVHARWVTPARSQGALSVKFKGTFSIECYQAGQCSPWKLVHTILLQNFIKPTTLCGIFTK